MKSWLLLGVVGMGLVGAKPAGAEPKRVLTTFTILQDMAQNVGGDRVRVESITKPGAEIHGYEPTPGDLVRAQKADLILWNGMNLERWFEKFFRRLRDVPGVVLTEGIEPLGISEGPYQGKPNPHAWMAPARALVYVENIRKALETLDPEGADGYRTRAAAYADRIRAVDAALQTTLSRIPAEQRWLVTSEGAFSYLTEAYGMRQAYLWPINADQQGTPQQVVKVVELVKKHRIPVVFSESTVSDKPARQVAADSGARYGGVLYVDSLTAADGPAPSYLQLLEANARTIERGFFPERP